MKSDIAKAVGLTHEPVALTFSDTKPENAKQFKEGKWGCVMFMLAAALKGEIVAFDRKTFGCQGGGVGLGFGNQYQNFVGGEEGFCHFLSTGNAEREEGRQIGEKVKPFMRAEAYDNFMHGERYVKSPELVKQFIQSLPIMEIPTPYLLFKPLKDVDYPVEKPETIAFLGDMDQISALTVLANYGRGTNENVIFPYAAGCQTLGIYPFKEAKSETPRAVLGLSDLSARLYLKRLLKDDVMSFTVPLALFFEMEANVPGSFLERHTWRDLRKLKDKTKA